MRKRQRKAIEWEGEKAGLRESVPAQNAAELCNIIGLGGYVGEAYSLANARNLVIDKRKSGHADPRE